jgi:hypothetical protein
LHEDATLGFISLFQKTSGDFYFSLLHVAAYLGAKSVKNLLATTTLQNYNFIYDDAKKQKVTVCGIFFKELRLSETLLRSCVLAAPHCAPSSLVWG